MRGLTTRATLGLVALFALPSLLLGAAWLASDRHQVVPGMSGCQFIRDRQPQIDCYSAHFEELVETHGLPAALRKVDANSASLPTLAADCHLAWHPLGERAGRHDARSGRAYANIDAASSCQHGYGHGYTIGYIEAANPGVGALARIMIDDCQRLGGELKVFNCVHGYGHSLAREAEGNVAAATRACQSVDYGRLPGGRRPSLAPGRAPAVAEGALHQCLYGMYMEIGIRDIAAGSSVRDNCGSTRSAPARKACYSYLPSRVGAMTGDMAAAGASCREHAPAGELRDSCVKTFSYGLHRVERCSLLVTRSEQETCRWVFELRRRNAAGETSAKPRGNPALAAPVPAPGSTPPL